MAMWRKNVRELFAHSDNALLSTRSLFILVIILRLTRRQPASKPCHPQRMLMLGTCVLHMKVVEQISSLLALSVFVWLPLCHHLCWTNQQHMAKIRRDEPYLGQCWWQHIGCCPAMCYHMEAAGHCLVLNVNNFIKPPAEYLIWIFLIHVKSEIPTRKKLESENKISFKIDQHFLWRDRFPADLLFAAAYKPIFGQDMVMKLMALLATPLLFPKVVPSGCSWSWWWWVG